MKGPTSLPSASLWRNRDYLLLWSGQAVSHLGSRVSGIAFPLLVLALTGSPAQAGFVGAVNGLPYLVFSLPAGALVDRWDRKRVMMLCDAGRAINAATIPLAAGLGHLSIVQLYFNSAIEGTFFVLFNVAEVASLRRVVGTEQIAAASAQNEAATNAASLGGPPLGGLIYQALGQTLPFLVDAVSYAVSVVSLSFIRATFQQEQRRAAGSMLTEILEGVRWFWHQPFVRFAAFRAASLNFVFNGTYLTLIVLAKQHHSQPGIIGVMLGLGSLGGLMGTFLAARIRKRLSLGTILLSVTWFEALVYPLFAFASTAVLLGLVYAALVVFVPTANAVILSYRLALIPDELQGRVNSAVRMITYGTVPAGTAVSGLLLQSIGPIQTVFVYAAIMFVLAAAITLNPRTRAVPSMLRSPAP